VCLGTCPHSSQIIPAGQLRHGAGCRAITRITKALMNRAKLILCLLTDLVLPHGWTECCFHRACLSSCSKLSFSDKQPDRLTRGRLCSLVQKLEVSCSPFVQTYCHAVTWDWQHLIILGPGFSGGRDSRPNEPVHRATAQVNNSKQQDSVRLRCQAVECESTSRGIGPLQNQRGSLIVGAVSLAVILSLSIPIALIPSLHI
jgi:hypothetical protein